MQYTLGTAAKATGKSKSTISRAIKDGKISASKDAHGRFQIDAAELDRVYPVSNGGNGSEGDETHIRATDNRTAATVELAELRAKVELQGERIAELKDDRDAWKTQAERLALTHAKDQEQAAPRSRGVWARLFGRS